MEIHLDILFKPLFECIMLPGSLRNIEPELHEELRRRMFWEVIEWSPITIAGWILILHPLRKRIFRSARVSRVASVVAMLGMLVGGGYLIAHLIHWATIYTGYYHMGAGAYFLMSSFMFCAIGLGIESIIGTHSELKRDEKEI
jgi:hypothetical protein